MGLALLVSVAALCGGQEPSGDAAEARGASPEEARSGASQPAALPRLIDVGAGKCEMCKRMIPIMQKLKEQYAGKLQVELIDLNVDPLAEQVYGIRAIPTQIFFDASGNELLRHEGYMPLEDILAAWKALGVDLPVEGGRQSGTTFLASLLAALTHALEGSWAVALAAAFLWGVLSVVLSPCHLASIPLVVAFISGQGTTSTRRALSTSTLFAAGILVTIGVIGAVTAVLGRILGDLGRWANYAVAAILFLVALHLIGVIPLPFSAPGQIAMKRKGLLAALVLGLVFGLAIGPCTFAYMVPVLAVAFKVSVTALAYGIALLASYGLGHCLVIVLAGTFTQLVQRYLDWSERSRGAIVLKRVCGVLVLLAGLYLIYTAR